MRKVVSEQEREYAKKVSELRYYGQIDKAISVCNEAAEKFENSNFFCKIKGDILFAQGNYDEALETYMLFLSKIKDEPEYFTNFSKFFYRLTSKEKVEHNALERLAGIVVDEEYTYILRKGVLKLILDAYIVSPELEQAIERAKSPLVQIDTIKTDYSTMKAKGKCDEIVYLCMATEKECVKEQCNIDFYFLKRLEMNQLYEQAITLTNKILTYSKDWVVVRTLFRLCRERNDYSDAKSYLERRNIEDVEEFNIQYELVLYFDAIGDEIKRNKSLDHIEKLSGDKIPICRTLFKFYVKFNMLDKAQDIQQRIMNFQGKNRNQHMRKVVWEAQREAQDIVWERLRTLVGEQEHNRQMLAISELIKGFSHELGQPITNIRYAIQLFYMRKEKENKTIEREERQLLDGVLGQTERVGKLLNRFSPIISSKSESTYFNVYNAISSVFDEMSSRLTNEGIDYKISGAENIEIYGDELQFSQVFYNLIINSIYAIHKKNCGGKIDVQICGGEVLKIYFTDNGIGIPREMHRKIFNPFFSTKKKEVEEGGEGLGLFIVWNILKIFSGRIYVDEDYVEGARFVMEIRMEENRNV